MAKNGGFAHLAFQVGVFFKGLDGILELIGGALLIAVPAQKLRSIVYVLTQHELSQDPHDWIATHALHAARHISSRTQAFAAVYLFAHGVIKVLLVYALLRRRLWAYPTAIVVFALFGVYQMYRYTMSHSMSMIVLTVLDVIVIVLTWVEYQRLKRESPPGAAAP